MTRLEPAKDFLLKLSTDEDAPGAEAAAKVLESFWPEL